MAPQFLELLIDAVFKPGSKINQGSFQQSCL